MHELSIEPEPLELMRKRSGTWAAYQNQDLSSRSAGHLQFLQYGEGRTYVTPPTRMPDTTVLGWRYMFAGLVDLENGTVMPKEEPT
jgi:hypothetical protein